MFSRFIHVVVWLSASFFFLMAEKYSVVWICRHQLIDLDCFYFLDIRNNATVTICAVFVWTLHWCISRCGWNSLVITLPNCSESSCTILHSGKHCMRVAVSLHPHQYVLLFVLLIFKVLITLQGLWDLSCLMGLNPHSWQWKRRVLTTGLRESSHYLSFLL